MIRTCPSGRVDPRFLIEPFEPAYLATHRAGVLAERVAAGLTELEDCCACPRNCHVNRLANETRVCHTGRYARVASAFPHFGEEDCLRGWNGSGTIFFSLCNLRCVFCQNWDISQKSAGAECPPGEIAERMLALAAARLPQHQLRHPRARRAPGPGGDRRGHPARAATCRSSTTPAPTTRSSRCRLLEGVVDIYMPDFKFWEPETARRLAKAKDYPERAREAIREMHRQVGVLRFGPDGLAARVLVRHLVMPGQSAEAEAIFGWLAEELSPDTYVNIMGQYRPEYEVGQIARDGVALKYSEIDRRPEWEELERACAAARRAGLWRFDERRAV